MKVLNMVNHGTVKFSCKRCSTTTDAEPGEYYQAISEDMVDHEPTRGALSRFIIGERTREFIPAWHFEIVCPICKNYVVESKRISEKSRFVEPPTVGLGG